MRWWSGANLISNAGTWMQLTAQNLLVLHLTHSAAAAGLSLAVQAAPALLLGLIGGAAVDRWPRRLTVGVSQSLLALVAFSTAALVTMNLLSVPVLLVLAAITGLIATVDSPACALFGNDLVPAEDVPSAIAVGSVVHSVGRVCGTALAGLTIGAFGVAGAYAANGLSFLCVVAVLPVFPAVAGAASGFARDPEARADGRPAAPAKLSPKASPKSAHQGMLRAGLAYFFTRRALVALAALSAVSSILGRNYSLTLAALVTGPMHGSMKQYAVIATVLAIGGTVGAILAGRLRLPTVPVVAAFTLAGALLQVAGALSSAFIMLVLLVAPMAVAESLSDTATTTILQTDPPPEMRGRVLGAWRSLSTAWQLAGPPLLGLLIQLLGARTALVAGGLVTTAAISVSIVLYGGRALGAAVAAPRRLALRPRRIGALALAAPRCTVDACAAACCA
ncbi:MAG: MFS transporter [Catenulispora sp.]